MRLMGSVCVCVCVCVRVRVLVRVHAWVGMCVSHLCKYNWNLDQRIYICLENCWTLFHQKLSVEMMVLSVWRGKQTMKYGLEQTGISKTQESSHEEVTNEDIACHFLRHQGYHLPQCHSTRPDSQSGLLCRMLTRLCEVLCRRAWILAQQLFIFDASTPGHWALCQAPHLKRKYFGPEHYPHPTSIHEIWLSWLVFLSKIGVLLEELKMSGH